MTTLTARTTTATRRSGTAARRRTARVGPDGRVDARDDAAEARRLAAALARWYAEALAGRRDARPLRDLLTPAVTQRVRCTVLREATRRHAGQRTQGAVVEVRAVHVQSHGDRHEALAVVHDGERSTAVVAALQRRATGWLVTDLARPEDMLPALPSPWFAD